MSQDIDCLDNLCVQSVREFDQMQHVWSVQLQEHTSDLARTFTDLMVLLDERV